MLLVIQYAYALAAAYGEDGWNGLVSFCLPSNTGPYTSELHACVAQNHKQSLQRYKVRKITL